MNNHSRHTSCVSHATVDLRKALVSSPDASKWSPRALWGALGGLLEPTGALLDHSWVTLGALMGALWPIFGRSNSDFFFQSEKYFRTFFIRSRKRRRGTPGKGGAPRWTTGFSRGSCDASRVRISLLLCTADRRSRGFRRRRDFDFRSSRSSRRSSIEVLGLFVRLGFSRGVVLSRA